MVVGEGPSVSVTLPESAIAEPSAPLTADPASTTGAALDTETWSEPERPSSSLTVTVIMWAPPVVYVWLPVHVPLPFDSETVPVPTGLPSPQLIVQVCVSLWPASVIEA